MTPSDFNRPAASAPPDDPARIARLSVLARHPSVDRAVTAARDLLGMDLAYVGEFVDSDQVFRALDGDAGSFGLKEGGSIPLADSYCQRMLDGRLENPLRDTLADEEAREMPITRRAHVRAYTSVPVVLEDGRFHGTLCCASHEARPDLGRQEVQMLHVLARLIADAIERDELQRERQRLLAETAGVTALIAAVEARDSYTGEHSRLVVDLATRVAQRIGVPRAVLGEVQQVALLHDIGKLAVPDAVLRKPGVLSAREWRSMRDHPGIGAQIVSAIPELAHLGPAIRAEHERWDGRGYPDGLAGRAIPVASRIVFVCDAYHAMTSDRPYRTARTPGEAVREIETCSGSQFCPASADALLSLAPELVNGGSA